MDPGGRQHEPSPRRQLPRFKTRTYNCRISIYPTIKDQYTCSTPFFCNIDTMSAPNDVANAADATTSAVGSAQWLANIIQERCKFEKAQDFQVKHGLGIIAGKDVFLVIAPGMGQTTYELQRHRASTSQCQNRRLPWDCDRTVGTPLRGCGAAYMRMIAAVELRSDQLA